MEREQPKHEQASRTQVSFNRLNNVFYLIAVVLLSFGAHEIISR